MDENRADRLAPDLLEVRDMRIATLVAVLLAVAPAVTQAGQSSWKVRRTRTLQFRQVGELKPGDVLYSIEGFESVRAGRVGVGDLISHPFKPMPVRTVKANASKVMLTWKQGDRVIKHAFHPDFTLRVLPADKIVRLPIDRLEPLGAEIRVHYLRPDRSPENTTIVRTGSVLVERVKVTVPRYRPEPSRPGAE